MDELSALERTEQVEHTDDPVVSYERAEATVRRDDDMRGRAHERKLVLRLPVRRDDRELLVRRGDEQSVTARCPHERASFLGEEARPDLSREDVEDSDARPLERDMGGLP